MNSVCQFQYKVYGNRHEFGSCCHFPRALLCPGLIGLLLSNLPIFLLYQTMSPSLSSHRASLAGSFSSFRSCFKNHLVRGIISALTLLFPIYVTITSWIALLQTCNKYFLIKQKHTQKNPARSKLNSYHQHLPLLGENKHTINK